MKTFLFASSIIAFLIVSCEPTATFDQPQPADTKSLSTFPDRVRGDYLSTDQASTLTITEELISRTYNFDYKILKDSLPHSYQLVADTLIDTTNGTKEKVVVKGDTVIQHVHETDTLFSLSPDNVVKEFKGYYFLNKRYSDNQWTVQKLSLKSGVLSVGNISDKDDINRLKSITKTPSDTISTHFRLTRKQFKEFVKVHGFSKEETFTRIIKNQVEEITESSRL